jgi:hypothetical protein
LHILQNITNWMGAATAATAANFGCYMGMEGRPGKEAAHTI